LREQPERQRQPSDHTFAKVFIRIVHLLQHVGGTLLSRSRLVHTRQKSVEGCLAPHFSNSPLQLHRDHLKRGIASVFREMLQRVKVHDLAGRDSMLDKIMHALIRRRFFAHATADAAHKRLRTLARAGYLVPVQPQPQVGAGGLFPANQPAPPVPFELLDAARAIGVLFKPSRLDRKPSSQWRLKTSPGTRSSGRLASELRWAIRAHGKFLLPRAQY
jgi:hypothetical protein